MEIITIIIIILFIVFLDSFFKPSLDWTSENNLLLWYNVRKGERKYLKIF